MQFIAGKLYLVVQCDTNNRNGSCGTIRIDIVAPSVHGGIGNNKTISFVESMLSAVEFSV